MKLVDTFLGEHRTLTRRYFFSLGVRAAVVVGLAPLSARAAGRDPRFAKVLEELEDYLTRQDEFGDVSRGMPVPHTLSEETKQQVGLTRDTWSLEVTSDPDHPADIRNTMTKEEGNALDWEGLMALAKDTAVSFPKVMTCNNIGCPLGMGIWEGVPLREVIWLSKPRRDVRRVFYYGYHNDKPEQIFRSSLPIGRVLEDPFGLPPIILCYKLNGNWLNAERGGPVRIVVPEAYGFKSVKWLTNIVLTNLFRANDTYANGNNDIDSWLKTFAATLSVPEEVRPDQPIPVTGYAQVGISGLSKVQVWISSDEEELPTGDKYFSKAPWRDAEILPAPETWGGGLPDGKMPGRPMGFDPETGRPRQWPLRLAKAHWAVLLPGLAAGEYTLRCRSVDANGYAQPMPRPFDKSGRNSIEQVPIRVKA